MIGGKVVELNVRLEQNFTQQTIDLTGCADEPIENLCAVQAQFVAQHAALIASWSPKLDAATQKLL